MKKTLVLFSLIFLIGCSVTKVNVSENYIKDISTFYTDPLPAYSDDYSVIWDYILTNNPYFQKYQSDGSRFKNKSRKEFWNEVDSWAPLLSEELNADKSDQEFAATFVGSKYNHYLNTVASGGADINAYALPNGYIFIGEGLIELSDGDDDAIFGVIAHEVAHVLFKHSERQSYSNKKRERKDNVLTGITAGVLAVAAGAGYATAVNGYTTQEEADALAYNYASTIYDITSAVNYGLRSHSYKKYFEYSREQEVEADIAAILFLKWLGLSTDSYIKILSKLPDSVSADHSTHPDIQFRVNFLRNYVLNNL